MTGEQPSGVQAGSRTVACGTLWNLIGRAGPILIALATTPYLIHELGPSRWGVFAIALSLVGIFGIFDFGLGRALTLVVTERVAAGHDDEAASLTASGLVVMAGLGLAAAAAGIVIAPFWVGGALRIPASLHREVLTSVYVLCAAIPLVILNAAFWGIISAFQKFREANLVNIAVMGMYYLGPVIVLQIWNSLVGVMLVLVACRLVLTVGYWRLCLQAMPALRHAHPDLTRLRPLLKLGGWITVSNVAWPILTYMDRFVIAGVMSAAATGYYSTPFDLMGRLSILTIAVNVSAYPAIAASSRVDPAQTAILFRRALLSVATILFPVGLFVVCFSNDLLTLWVGADFASKAAPVMRWISIGVVLMSMDSVAANLIDGVGRPDANAKLSLVELAVSVPLLLVLLRLFGLEGAAIAWTTRCAVDLLVRLRIATVLFPAAAASIRALRPTMAACAATLLLPFLFNGTIAQLTVIAVSVPFYLAVVARFSLTREERGWIVDRLRIGNRLVPVP